MLDESEVEDVVAGSGVLAVETDAFFGGGRGRNVQEIINTMRHIAGYNKAYFRFLYFSLNFRIIRLGIIKARMKVMKNKSRASNAISPGIINLSSSQSLIISY